MLNSCNWGTFSPLCSLDCGFIVELELTEVWVFSLSTLLHIFTTSFVILWWTGSGTDQLIQLKLTGSQTNKRSFFLVRFAPWQTQCAPPRATADMRGGAQSRGKGRAGGRMGLPLVAVTHLQITLKPFVKLQPCTIVCINTWCSLRNYNHLYKVSAVTSQCRRRKTFQEIITSSDRTVTNYSSHTREGESDFLYY